MPTKEECWLSELVCQCPTFGYSDSSTAVYESTMNWSVSDGKDWPEPPVCRNCNKWFDYINTCDKCHEPFYHWFNHHYEPLPGQMWATRVAGGWSIRPWGPFGPWGRCWDCCTRHPGPRNPHRAGRAHSRPPATVLPEGHKFYDPFDNGKKIDVSHINFDIDF